MSSLESNQESRCQWEGSEQRFKDIQENSVSSDSRASVLPKLLQKYNNHGHELGEEDLEGSLALSGNRGTFLTQEDTEELEEQDCGEQRAGRYKPAERLLHDLPSANNGDRNEDQIMHETCSIVNEQGSSSRLSLQSRLGALAQRLRKWLQRRRDGCIWRSQRLKCLLTEAVPDTQREWLAQGCRWAAHLASGLREDEAAPGSR